MNRRIFVTHAAAVVGFATVNACAQVSSPAPAVNPQPALDVPVEKLIVTTAIASNHGHELILTDVTVIKILREAHAKGSVVADIKGASSHSHALTLTESSLIAILVDGKIDLESATGAGHTHKVTIKLEVV